MTKKQRKLYQKQWNEMKLKKWKGFVRAQQHFSDNFDEYEDVQFMTGVPAEIVFVIHWLECGGKFDRHLHNGDPLTKPTTHVPKNKPVHPSKWDGEPFTWLDSAVDALKGQPIGKNTCWTIPETLDLLEKYNGLGYRNRGIPSPYLWSGSNQYVKGKYVADGKFDPNAVSKQIGAACLLSVLGFNSAEDYPHEEFTTIAYGDESEAVGVYQTFLQAMGYNLNADNKAGQITSDAHRDIFGVLLLGDPRI